jgi:hypothetical protein
MGPPYIPGCEKPNSKGQCYVGMPEDEEEQDTKSTTDNENSTDEFFVSGSFFN